MNQETRSSCIAACDACADACDGCAVMCLQEPDPKKMVNCVRLDLDCAAICRLAAGAISRSSDFTELICLTCAQICEACAEECRKYDMAHCRQCAEACKSCASECRRMAA